MITFATIDKDGRTPAADPKRAAYAYMWRLQAQGKRTNLIVDHRTGEFEVRCPGLMTLIFCPEVPK